MSIKRWLPFSLLFVLSLARFAHASNVLTSDPSPVTFGNVAVDPATAPTQSATIVTVTMGDLVGGHVDHFGLAGTDCMDVTINPEAPKADVNAAATLPITVTFSPTVRSTINCVVQIDSTPGGNPVGTFTVTGTGIAPVLSIAPTSPPAVDFGSVSAASGSSTVTFTLKNTGDAGTTLHVQAPTFGGSTEYTLVSAAGFPAALAQNGTKTFQVKFDPSTTGTRTATMTVVSDAPISGTQTVALTGVGTSPVINVSPSMVPFGTVANGTTSPTMAVTVSNTGSGTLTLNSGSLTGAIGSFITFGQNGAANCAGLTTCTFNLSITPATPASIDLQCSPPNGASGTQTSTLTFASNTDAGGTNTSTVTCTAGPPVMVVSPPSLDFGTVNVGTPSASQMFTVTNNGLATLHYAITKSPSPSTEYAITGCTTACTLAAGAMVTGSIIFTPTAVGTDAITLTVTGDDPVTPTSTIALTGVGKGGIATITVPATPPIAFGSVDVGTTSAGQTITVTNTGNGTLTIHNAGFGTANFEALTGTTGPQTTPIAANGSLSWSVACNPSTFGLLNDTFTITSDGIGSATRTVAVNCTGNAGALTVTQASINFGNVRDGDIANIGVVLKNVGTATVNNITDVFSSTTAGYSFTTAVPTTLTAGQSATINVQFAPTMTSQGGNVTVNFNGMWTGGMTPATLNIQGVGQQPGFNVSPATFSFGSIRFDQTATQTFTIANTDTAVFKVVAVPVIAPDLATMTTSTEFTVQSVTHNGTAATFPFTMNMGDTLIVTVKCAPTARVGALHATMTVTSDLNPPNTTRTVDLSGTITAGIVTLAPNNGVFDFGGVDVDAGPATQMVTLQNTGTGNLDVDSITKMAGGSSAFSVTLPTGVTTLAPNDTLTLTITYKPPAVEADSLTLLATLAGALPPAPESASFMITGHGIDRFIVAPSSVTFPSAFRNPGSEAPVMPVTISNAGQANLHVSAVMVDNPDVYKLMGATTVDIAGGTSHDFMVAFTPTMAGAAPVGHLTIDNNDNTSASTMMAVVLLNGTGVSRNVMLGPDTIELGFTGVGLPVTIPDVLTITSMDSTNTFTIASVTLSDDQPFSIDDAPLAEALAPSETKTFGVTFAPTAEGDFTTTAQLFLDQDPVAQNMITLHGHAVFVDAHGGGGCNAGGDRGGLLLVLGVLAFTLRRKRSIDSAPPFGGAARAGKPALASILAVLGLAGAARADNLDLTLFNPTPSTTGESFQLLSPDVGENGNWVASGVVSYATDPLVLGAFDQGSHINDDRQITQRTLFELGGAYAFLDRFEAGARMPLYTQSGDAADMTGFGVPPTTGTARGDLTLHGKARLWRGPAIGGSLVTSLGLELTLPTASANQFTGEDGPSGRALALIGYTPNALGKRLAISINAGAVLRKRSDYLNVEQGSGMAWGLGGSVRVLDELWVTGEIFGELIPSGSVAEMGGKSALSPIEALGGLNYRIAHGVTIGLAAGRGVTSGLGSPALRGVFALTFVSGAPAAVIPGHTPLLPGKELDTDGDGIPDSRDKCPLEPEDFDMFDDEDGCPDPDNDGDGIPDKLDKCPLDPEDFDGFEDADGCPDKDNDGDGIPDAIDKCPNEPEDKDGFEDLDGCPDPDNDHDGIPDALDKCPNEPETINGFQDEDGCPDKGDGLVSLSPDRLELLEAVKFNGGKLDPASNGLLAQVGATLRAHTEIFRIRVTSHVQPTKNADRDQELSDQRATAVRDWLVKWGTEPARLEVRGFGGTKPLVPADQKGAKLVNNRLELIILERK